MSRQPVSHLEYDELCDLPTMMYFRMYASSYIHAALSNGRKVYLIYFNLENFSIFCERYGFEEGDKLLILTSVAIRAAFPGYLVSRISEDHFLAVCESYDVEGSILDVREQLHAYGRNANVELKAGIVSVEDEDTSVSIACDYAKTACDSIAHRYDRTFRWYDDALAWRIEQKNYIESHIHRAIECGWIQVYFQPIVRSITGKVCEFEALARWNDPRYGLLPPGLFVEVLEQARLIHKLDECVVRLVCQQWHELDATGPWRVPVSVNLSRFDFELTDAFAMVDNLAREYGVPHQMLHVEVTESALNESSDRLAHEVSRFREAGYQVWLDDFGSGYSSLNTLKDYVFDVVKIDMVFLREFDSKPKSRVIITNIVNMAKQLGMQTLIEGVETPEQFDFVRDIGCEFVQGYLIGRPVPSENNVERILAGELEVETVSLHGYYDRIGSVNALSAAPFDFPWEKPVGERPLGKVPPLAVIEREGGAIRFMLANETFVEVLREVGVESAEQVTERVNRANSPQGRIVLATIQTAVETGEAESVDLIFNGMHCVLRCRHIISHERVDALLVSFVNLTRFSNADDDKLLQIAMRYLYVVYDLVNIVDLSDGRASTLYRGNSWLPAVQEDMLARDAVNLFSLTFVHPDDRVRFLEYMDFDTVGTRVENSKRSHLADAFRLLGPDGRYEWATTVLVPLTVDDGQTVLVCMRSSNLAVCSTMANEEKIPKALLWDTLIDLIPAGVFWKDKDRRFAGVNKQFLEFYEFRSTNDVLGKNDEDMGWHVDEDPFKDNELRVLQGDRILNAHGTCLARGEVHNILASKVPLWRNGEVIGLLGYFHDDIGEGSGGGRLVQGRVENTDEIDQLTGIPNLRGLLTSAASYDEAYKTAGHRYLMAVMDIRDMGGLNDVYGRSFGSRIIKTVARGLAVSCGVSGVVSRTHGDRFAALRQVSSEKDAEREAEALRGVIEGVHEVDGIRVVLRCALGWALSTEAEDVLSLLELAERRMQGDRMR